MHNAVFQFINLKSIAFFEKTEYNEINGRV